MDKTKVGHSTRSTPGERRHYHGGGTEGLVTTMGEEPAKRLNLHPYRGRHLEGALYRTMLWSFRWVRPPQQRIFRVGP